MLYLDTETTGLNHNVDEIVEIAIIDDQANVLLDTLVRPIHAKTWHTAERIHGISPNDVKDAPTLFELSRQIHEITKNQEIVIYNAPFDAMFLINEIDNAKEIHCCMTRYAEFKGDWDDYHGNFKWHKLVEAARFIGFDWSGLSAHRALADTLACRAVWQYLDRQPKQHKSTLEKTFNIG